MNLRRSFMSKLRGKKKRHVDSLVDPRLIHWSQKFRVAQHYLQYSLPDYEFFSACLIYKLVFNWFFN